MSPERRILVLSLGLWVVTVGLLLCVWAPLGHDESAHALGARAVDSGAELPWLYRPVGLTLLAWPGVAAGGAEWLIRLPAVLLGASLVVAVHALGRRAAGARTGALAAAVVAGAHPLVLRGSELLGDLGAAAGIVAAMAVIVAELEREDGPRWRLLAAAPLLAGAFYLRYGSAPAIALVALGALVIWRRRVVTRPAPVLVTALAFVALLLPHLAHALAATGSPLGILRLSSGVPRRAYVGEGLVTYLTSNPFAYYGVLVTPVLLAALAGIIRAPRGAGRRPARFLAVVALGQLVAVGLVSHAQPRYVYVAVVLLVILGVDALRRAAATRPAWQVAARRAGVPLVALAALGCALAAVPLARFVARARAPLHAAAAKVRADAAGRPCLVLAPRLPQYMWYSGCAGALTLDPAAAAALGRDARIYVISVAGERVDVPAVAAATAPRGSAEPVGRPAADGVHDVWRVLR